MILGVTRAFGLHVPPWFSDRLAKISYRDAPEVLLLCTCSCPRNSGVGGPPSRSEPSREGRKPSIPSETGLDFVKNATLTRAISLQIITGLEIFPVTSCDVRPHRLPSALEDCGHRTSGYAFNNRLREPAD